MLCALLAITAAGTVQERPGWKSLEAVRMVGTERYFDGPDNPVSLARQSGKTMFYTSGGLQGALMGQQRKEVTSATGVFTWLTVFPDHCLWLPVSSTGHYAALMQPVRFSKKDLSNNRVAVERLLGSSIVRFSEGTAAGRSVYDMVLADKTSANTRQELWIDQETGLIVRRSDGSGQNNQYELRIDRLDTRPTIMPETFSPVDGAVRIKGPADPEILSWFGGTVKRNAAKELAEKGREIGATAWLRTIPAPEGFEYIETIVRKRPAGRGNTPLIGSALGAPELQPGGVPSGWSVGGQVDTDRGAIGLAFTTPDGPGARAIISMPKPGSDGSSFTMTMSRPGASDPDVSISFVAYVAPDGTLVLAPGNSAQKAEEARQRARRTIGANGALVQSDFLDRKTGDTVSFVQSRNVDLPARLRGFAVKAVEGGRVDGLGGVNRYEAVSPYLVHVLTWRGGDAEYLLASTRLSIAEMEQLALRSRPLGGTTNE